jgi:hypothetical protein
MREEDEAKSLVRVVDELHERFPGVPTVVVERLVTEGYRSFDGAPVRDYIPVMVKRSARESLATLVSGSRNTFDRQF